ncbi:hypothetical protein [Streptomyces sp. cg35]|uniref:hypothetical protein n=1 Tax=Streptomyces sp. cg35 TaxID=3421650 RepID=UPI003D16339D
MIREIEGYLMVEAARSEGRSAARRFVERMPWLTESQAADVQRAYLEAYLGEQRELWRRSAERARELRAEYEGRYQVLRRRFVGAALVVGVVVMCGVLVVGG